MKRSVIVFLVLTLILLITAISVGAMSVVKSTSVAARAGVVDGTSLGPSVGKTGAETHHETVNMVFPIAGNPVSATIAAEQLAALLEVETGYTVNAIMANCPGAAVNMMVTGDANFGWLSSVPFVYADRLGAAEVKLVAERLGQTYHRGQFMVRKDSGLNTLESLAGKNFAFADPESASGYLYPSLHIIETQGMTPDEFFANTLFAGGHTGAVKAVYNGEYKGTPVDAGASFEDARVLVDKEISETLKVVEYTGKIPNDTVVARPGQDLAFVQNVIDGLTAVAGSPEWDALMKDLYGWEDVAPAQDSDFEISRQAVDVLHLEMDTCGTTAKVDDSGGALLHTSSTGLTTTVQVAPETFSETVRLGFAQVSAATNLPPTFIDPGIAFTLTAVISSTGQNLTSVPNPYQVVISYDENSLGGLHEKELALYHWKGNEWVKEPTSQVDTENNRVTAYPDHFSLFAVMGSKKTHMPMIISG